MPRSSVICKCVCHCVIVCNPTFFSVTVVHRAQRTRHQCQSRRALCTHTQRKPSRAGAVGSRSELVELGACVGIWLSPGLKKHYRKILDGFGFWSSTLRNPTIITSTRRHTVPAHSNVGPCPKTCCRWCCQAHLPTDEGTEKQEKICRRFSSSSGGTCHDGFGCFEFYRTKPNYYYEYS